MKKLVIAAMAFGAFAVLANDGNVDQVKLSAGVPYVGMQAGHNFEANINPVSVQVGTKWDKFGLEGAYARSTGGTTNVNQWSAVGSYDLITYEKITVDVKLGAVYVQPSVGFSGWQATYGIGASMPVAQVKNTYLTTSYVYQNGQSNVDAWNGGTWNFGVKYSF